jgi:hypothetical protein
LIKRASTHRYVVFNFAPVNTRISKYEPSHPFYMSILAFTGFQSLHGYPNDSTSTVQPRQFNLNISTTHHSFFQTLNIIPHRLLKTDILLKSQTISQRIIKLRPPTPQNPFHLRIFFLFYQFLFNTLAPDLSQTSSSALRKMDTALTQGRRMDPGSE